MKRWAILAFAMGVWACASTPTPTQHATFAEQTALSLQRAQETEIQLHRAGSVSTDDHRMWQLGFRSLAQALQIYTQAIRARDPLKRAGAFQVMSTTLAQLSLDLVPRITDVNGRVAVQVALDAIRAVLSQWTTTVEISWIPRPLAPSFASASN